jgi:hypothetical protein
MKGTLVRKNGLLTNGLCDLSILSGGIDGEADEVNARVRRLEIEGSGKAERKRDGEEKKAEERSLLAGVTINCRTGM